MISKLFGIGKFVVSNYFVQCVLTDISSLRHWNDARIKWTTQTEWFGVRHALREFPDAIGFVDGVKSACWRPTTEPKQGMKYDWHHKIHCNAALVWVYFYRLPIRFDFTTLGSTHDSRIFTPADPVVNRADYFSDEETVIGDTGFIGPGLVVCPYKRNQGHSDPDRVARNRDILCQRWISKHEIGYLWTKFRVFLGRWSWREYSRKIILRNVAHISNYIWRVSSIRLLQPQQCFIERMDETLISSLDFIKSSILIDSLS